MNTYCVDTNDEVIIVDEAYEDLMGSLEASALHEGDMLEEKNETSKPCIFKIDNWFVYADNQDVQEKTKWLGNTSINEVQKPLGQDLQDFKIGIENITAKLKFLENWLNNPRIKGIVN